jgi:hypothetical protein
MSCSIACSLSLLAFLSVPASAADAMGASVSTAAPAGHTGPLADLNAGFREAYARLREKALADGGPVLLDVGGDLILLRGGARETAPTTLTPRYHDLKAVTHASLGAYALLAPAAGGSLSAAVLQDLEALRRKIDAAREDLPRRFSDAGQLDRQRRLLDRVSALAARAASEGKLSTADLDRFAASQRADLDRNLREAAGDQIEAIDRQLEKWLAAMTAEESARLRVVVVGSHMPRRGHVAFQYYRAKLGLPRQGRLSVESGAAPRVVFAEATWDEAKARSLLGTHEVDARISRAFFGDPERLHRDALADGAEQVLAEKFGRRNAAAKKR